MPLERLAGAGSSWVQKAGYTPVRRRQGWLITIGAVPILWFLVNRDFASSGFRWAAFALMAVPALATAWAAIRLRCCVCGIPVYAFWLLGFPRGRERPAFEALAGCPYCLDDGTGKTGDARRVDRREEIKAAIHYGLVAMVLFIGLMAVVFVLAVLGVLPGYERAPRPAGSPRALPRGGAISRSWSDPLLPCDAPAAERGRRPARPESFGHAQIQATAIYTHVAPGDLWRVVENAHPRGGAGAADGHASAAPDGDILLRGPLDHSLG